MTLRLIDTFSGIGGFSYAAEKLVGGFKTVSFVECEPFCQKVLKKHWPDVPIYEDIRTYDPEPYSADVICGGFPCQSISNAGKREGITETSESGLWYELYRVICLLQPRYVVLENVSAILSRGLGIVLGNLAEAGYCCEYACIPASYIGACHQRDRWFLIAYPDSMLRFDVLRQQPEQRQETHQGTSDRNNRSGNVANSKSERTGEYKSRLRGQSERRDLQTDRDTNQKISTVTDSNGERLEGQIGTRISRSIWWEATPASRRLNPNWSEYASKPVLCRGNDGVPSGLDRTKRLKALGNSIVPQVAAIPLKRVLDLANAAQDI